MPGRGAAAAVATILAAAILLAPASEARVSEMVVPVRGMTCALCTRGVEESIRALGGVSRVAADLSSGLVRVEAVEGRSLGVREVKARVHSAGFKLGGECSVTAVGRFTIGPDRRITFRVLNAPYAYQVLEGDLLRRLFRRHPGLTGDFRIGFRLHEHQERKPPSISITSFEARPALPPPARR
jgi:copper chaperone CopZ